MKYSKRLIEVDLPIARISEHARRDQNIRKGHLHTMHVWWATRPLASCRAVLMATLLPDPGDPNCPKDFLEQARTLMREWATRYSSRASAESYPRLVRVQKNPAVLDGPDELRGALLDFIADFSAWEAGVDESYLRTARALVAAAHPGGPPYVLDPFACAGSIPFEALRVGAQAFASDLNPIPVLLNKVALEYLPKYGTRLADGVRKWGQWVLEEGRKRLGRFYPADKDGNIPLAYIWARTVRCEGPGCGAEVPLLGMLWLSKKAKNPVALRYHGDPETKRVEVEIFHPKSARDVQPGIVKGMAATCPCCGYTTPYKNTREQLRAKRGGTNDARMVAVITLDAHGGRHFRLPAEADRKAAEKAARDLARIEQNHNGRWSFVPHEPTPPDGTLGYRINKYGMEQWSDVYLPRQALALGTLCDVVREARTSITAIEDDNGLSQATSTCLGIAVSNLAAFCNSIAVWSEDHMGKAFMQGSGLAMRPDFAEANPLMPKLVGGLAYALSLVEAVVNRECATFTNIGTAQKNSATSIPLPDDSLNYVVTDPPYYDAIPYAALSDFCYVWMRRALGDVNRDLFTDALTPKTDECIMDPGAPAESGVSKDREYFETTMQAALADARRVLRPDGLCVVIFAHKGTAGWEALLNALVAAGWTVTASWPIDTENASRMRAKNSAALGSSVHLVCRPRDLPAGRQGNPDGSLRTEEVGDWRDVLAELPKRIQEWMPKLTAEGIVGADAIFACLGPALEIFSRYSRVEKASGEEVKLPEYLEHVWAAVSKEALSMLFSDADATGLEPDARLTAMWLWTLGAGKFENGRGTARKATEGGDGADEEAGGKKTAGKNSGGYVLEYDAARKIAQGLGAHLDKLPSVVEVAGDKARLIPVAERTKYLFGKESEAAQQRRRRRKKDPQRFLFAEMEAAIEEAEAAGWAIGGGAMGTLPAGKAGTVLDRVHQAMILFAAGRSEAVKRFLVEDGAGTDARFWKLADNLAKLYPAGSDERRWVEGVLARKKGLGF